jgi:PAS domain S-box-containing protein
MKPYNLNELFMQAPVAICIVSGADYKVELVNERMLQFLGRTPEITGHPISKTLTEAAQQGLIAILDTVRKTKQPYYISDFPSVILIDGSRETRYFSLAFKPYFLSQTAKEPDAIFCVAHNTTEQVLALQKLEEEKQRTQLALDAGELGIVATQWKSNSTASDKRAREIFGFEDDRPLEDYVNRIHPEDRTLRKQAIDTARETGGFDFEVRLLLDDGSIRWMRSRGLLQKDIEGNITGSFGVVQDITQQKEFALSLHKKVEERTRELEEQKRLLDNILHNSSNGISVSKVFRDETGKVIDALTILANDAAVKYIGLPKDIYLSKKATEIEPAVMTSPYYQACIKTLETGEPFIMQYYMESTKRWLELTVSKLDYDHLIQIFTDVTPIKEVQIDLEQTVESLRQSNLKLEEFTRAASHDLKEPIRKVHFFTERLKDLLADKLNREEKLYFERVETAAERMQLLVDDLLDYSHLNHMPLEQSEIDLNDKIRLILSDIELLVREKKATFDIDKLPVVKGYRRQVQQLFQNIITNALKYSRPGIAPHITITAKDVSRKELIVELPASVTAQRFHLIEVCDNGIGFDQENAERIFNVFTRLHGNKEYPGTGIGLSIAKKVVENHHGFIYAKGEAGKGACFSILLPAS